MRYRLLASGSLALGGLFLMVMGIYFAFLRPAILPEDARYIGASLTQIESAIPRMTPWLDRVFGVLAGFMFATGLLTLFVAATSFKAGTRGAVWIVSFSGLASIGWMAITNFLIDSDFKWLLLALTLPWVITLLLLAADRFSAGAHTSG